MDKRKIFTGVLCVMLALSVFALVPVTAYAEVITQDGIVFDTATGTITDYTGDAVTLDIPAAIGGVPVVAIGILAFDDCDEITSLTIPLSVESIGQGAFVGCGFDKIDIPSSVKSIGLSAFMGCASLKTVAISSGVNSIGNQAFAGCGLLTEINVSAANTVFASIDGVLFTKDGKTLILYPDGITGAYTTPSGVTSIRWEAFAFSKISDITISSDVKKIDVGAFMSCKSLSAVTISSGVTNIEYNAFVDCDSLTGVNIPPSVTVIEENAFGYCDVLTEINVSEANTKYKSVNGILFTKDGKTIEAYPSGLSGGYAIPSGTENIGGSAFFGCKNITSISMPSGLKTIEGNAFGGCTALTSVTIPYGVTSIGSFAFSACSGLKSVTVAYSVENIMAALTLRPAYAKTVFAHFDTVHAIEANLLKSVYQIVRYTDDCCHKAFSFD